MRIIGGKYRGRKLNSPLDEKVRPTTDKVKESVFNMLMPYIYDSDFLDLFSGSGAIASEAISRGAKTCTCVENNSKSIQTMKKNFAYLLDDAQKVNMQRQDVLSFLNTTSSRFDIIFADPYYDYKHLSDMVNIIATRKLIKDSGVFILETDKAVSFDLPDNLVLEKTKIYSITKINVMRYKDE